MRRAGLVVAALVVALTMGGITGSTAVPEPPPRSIGDDHHEVLDARTDDLALAPTAAQAQAMGALVRALPDTTVRWNHRFGTPGLIIRHGSTLSDAVAGTPVDAARAWLRSHAAVFGWDAAAVDGLQVVKSLAQPGGGVRSVLFHQLFGGLEGRSFGGSIVVALDTSNRVVSVGANAVRAPALTGAVRLTAAAAVTKAAGLTAPVVAGTRAGWTEFLRGNLAGPSYARPVAFPTGDGPARRAYEVLSIQRLASGVRAVVDAETAEVLFQTELAKHADPEGRVFKNHPGAKQGGTHELVPFKSEWFTPTPAGLTTAGNNASTATNWGVFIAPDGPGQLRPVGSLDHPFNDTWAQSDCAGPGDTPDMYAPDALPAAVNLFYHHNLMHDFFYALGFDEPAGAMQLEDGKPGGAAGDPLIGLVQAGAAGGDSPTYLGRDNAYMFPMEDGIPSWSGMFLFEPIAPADGGFLAPCVDGDFDAGVIYHEYAHGVTSRWVSGEFGNIDTYQGASMGESWSDFYGLHFLQSHGLQSDTVLGRYDTGNDHRGIRNWPVGEVPVGFDDLGYDVAGEEVHADGEIWNGVLWDIRTRLGAARGGQKGHDLAAHLIADAMPIAKPLPSMVDMRDAILAADVARTRGANQDLLWEVFANRGLGKSARSVDANDINPKPGFDHKTAARNGAVAGRVVNAVTGKPVTGARILVGEYEGRVSAAAKTGSQGTFSLKALGGPRRITVQARGYGARTFDLQVPAGGTVKPRIALTPNVASTAAGAKIVSVSNPSVLGPPEFALDDTEGSTWWTDPDEDGPVKEHFVVDLAGDKPVSIDTIQVSAMISPAGNRFEALRDFKVWSSLDGKTWKLMKTGSFPTMDPRPVTPDLHYKQWKLRKPVSAKFLKFAGTAQAADAGGLHVAELQAFANAAVTVTDDTGTDDDAFHDEGQVIVASADGTATYTLMSNGLCVFPPPTQGIDAWVSELPDSYADGAHMIDVRAEPLAADPRPDVDLYFLSADCRPTGSIASTAPRETGTVPQGTKYLVTQLYTTALADVVVEGQRIQ